MFEFKLPDLGEGIHEGEMVGWTVKVGDKVENDQVIAEIMTDKATVEISTPKSGVVSELCFKEGDIAKVGETLIKIDETGVEPQVEVQSKKEESSIKSKIEENNLSEPILESAVTGNEKEPNKLSPSAKNEAVSKETNEKPEKVSTSNVIDASTHHPPSLPQRPGYSRRASDNIEGLSVNAVPAVRQLAQEMNINISLVKGSGPNGRVMKSDLESFKNSINEKSPLEKMISQVPGNSKRILLKGLRKNISRNMTLSKQKIPHYTYVEEIDVSEIEKGREKWNKKNPKKKLSPLPIIAKVVAETLLEYPNFNACLDEDSGEIVQFSHINLGVAIGTPNGLIVPVIKQANQLSVMELSDQINGLSKKIKLNKLSPKDVQGGTFTITSLGKMAGIMATPIIRYPEVGILSIHKIRKEPRYKENDLVPTDLLNLAISLDHRIVDGLEGSQFIYDIKQKLESLSAQAIGELYGK